MLVAHWKCREYANEGPADTISRTYGNKKTRAERGFSVVARRGLEAAFESNTLEQSRTEWPLVYSDVANTPASSHRPGWNRHVRQIPTNYLLK